MSQQSQPPQLKRAHTNKFVDTSMKLVPKWVSTVIDLEFKTKDTAITPDKFISLHKSYLLPHIRKGVFN